MNLLLRWTKPLPLRADGSGFYWTDIEEIPNRPGIYLFIRTHGASSEVLYVGKAGNLHSRIKGQFNNHRLMVGVVGAASGRRELVFAEFAARQGQQAAKALKRMETALIRYYIAEGHQLLNIQGTKIRRDAITSERSHLKKLIPLELFFEP